MACTMGSRDGEPAWSQAVRRTSIAQRAAYMCVPADAGPPSGGSYGKDTTGCFGATDSGQPMSVQGRSAMLKDCYPSPDSLAPRRSARLCPSSAVFRLPRHCGGRVGRVTNGESGEVGCVGRDRSAALPGNPMLAKHYGRANSGMRKRLRYAPGAIPVVRLKRRRKNAPSS